MKKTIVSLLGLLLFLSMAVFTACEGGKEPETTNPCQNLTDENGQCVDKFCELTMVGGCDENGLCTDALECVSKKNPEDLTPQLVPQIQLPEPHSVYIKSLYERDGGGKFMSFNNVLWLQGEEAIVTAMKDTGCPREKITDGNCAPSLNNDFYKKDLGPNDTPLEISNDVKIYDMINQKMTYEELKEHYKNNQYFEIVFDVKILDGKVVEIHEKYNP